MFLKTFRDLVRITPYSGRAIHVGPFHVDPIHVETDSCPIGLIHVRPVRPFSCPTLFMFNMTDSCRPFSCRDRFMSVPIHVRPYSCPKVPFHVWPDSCLTLFMSKYWTLRNISIQKWHLKENLSLPNLTKPNIRSRAPNPAGASTHLFMKVCWLVLCVPELS